MKIIVLFLLSWLMANAVYADQRLSDVRPGIPCDRIAETEKRLGSVAADVHGTQSTMRYTGTQGGEKATIIYHCDKGRLTEQTIIVTSTTRDEAYRFAEEQKTALTKRLGEPVHDGLDLGIWKRLYFGFMGADLDYLLRVVVWGKKKEDAMLLIKETGVDQWEVSISQGSSKMEYILNS
jgi:hypothetical protein